MKQADLDEGRRSNGLTTREHRKLAALRRRNRVLEMENETSHARSGLLRGTLTAEGCSPFQCEPTVHPEVA